MANENISNPIKPKIYAYTTPEFKEKGFLKIGYTTRDVNTRIAEQFPTKNPHLNPYEIVLDELAIDKNGNFFEDFEVHKRLEKKGFQRINGEWFKCKVEDIKSVINEIRDLTYSNETRASNFSMRPEQKKLLKSQANISKNIQNKKRKKLLIFYGMQK